MPFSDNSNIEEEDVAHLNAVELMFFARQVLGESNGILDTRQQEHLAICSLCAVEVERLCTIIGDIRQQTAAQSLLAKLEEKQLLGDLKSHIEEQSTKSLRLERRVQQVMRSIDIPLISFPAYDAICIGNFKLAFVTALTTTATLAIFNDQDQLKLKLELEKGTCNRVLPLADAAFPTGLYYWTLVQNNSSITRRFFVSSVPTAKSLLAKAE